MGWLHPFGLTLPCWVDPASLSGPRPDGLTPPPFRGQLPSPHLCSRSGCGFFAGSYGVPSPVPESEGESPASAHRKRSVGVPFSVRLGIFSSLCRTSRSPDSRPEPVTLSRAPGPLPCGAGLPPPRSRATGDPNPADPLGGRPRYVAPLPPSSQGLKSGFAGFAMAVGGGSVPKRLQ